MNRFPTGIATKLPTGFWDLGGFKRRCFRWTRRDWQLWTQARHKTDLSYIHRSRISGEQDICSTESRIQEGHSNYRPRLVTFARGATKSRLASLFGQQTPL